jgi:hypothetical protein
MTAEKAFKILLFYYNLKRFLFQVVYYNLLSVSVVGMILALGNFTGNPSSKNEITCEISSYHGGEYEVQICLLGCTAV